MEKKKPVIPIVLLDLFTSSASNADVKFYEFRYRSFQLSENLKVFCDHGAKVVFFDIFLDEISWLGKFLTAPERAKKGEINPKSLKLNGKEFQQYLTNANQEAKELQRVLFCYEHLLIAVRDKSEETFYFPISPILEVPVKISYVHVNTLDSRLYSIEQTFRAEKGKGVYPYAGVMLSQFSSSPGLQPEDYPHQKMPLQFGYHPSSFPRFQIEDMDHFHQNAQYLNEDERKKWLKNPEIIVVGFTHDPSNQHHMPFTLRDSLFSSSEGKSSFQVENIQTGKEEKTTIVKSSINDPISTTPGIFAVLSTANALADKKIPSYPFHRFRYLSFFFFGFLIWGFLSWSKKLELPLKIVLVYVGFLLFYFILNTSVFFYQVYFPLYLPLLAIFSAMGTSYFLFRPSSSMTESLSTEAALEDAPPVIEENQQESDSFHSSSLLTENLSTEAALEDAPPVIEENQQESDSFHSGKRLKLARELGGHKQEGIIGEEGFPPVDVRTLREWEKKGIPMKRLKEVADFFHLNLQHFAEKSITEEEFRKILYQFSLSSSAHSNIKSI